MTRAACVALALFLTSGCREKPGAPPLKVAAASDLTEAFTALGAQFEAETGTKVSFSFGSSGLLAKQLAEGAPFDLFASASDRFVQDTVAAGACDGSTVGRFARGRLALYGLTPATSLEVLSSEGTKKIALANPEHAPYGQAAREALEHAGLLERVQRKLVMAENVRQALQFAKTGNADFAFVAFANVPESERARVLVIDAALHAPIEQSLVTCKRGGNAGAAKQFSDFLTRPASLQTLRRFGFEP